MPTCFQDHVQVRKDSQRDIISACVSAVIYDKIPISQESAEQMYTLRQKKESTKREKNDSHLFLQWKMLYIMIIWQSSYIQHVKQTRETFILTHSLGIFFTLMERLGYENSHCFFHFHLP